MNLWSWCSDFQCLIDGHWENKCTVGIVSINTFLSTASIRNTLDVLHRRCIRKILGLSWQDCVTEELMRRSGMQALSKIVQTRRLRLAGHVLWLLDVRPARVAMTWIPESGRRTSGWPQMTWQTSFKEDLHRMNLTWYGARRAGNDRHRWRNLVVQCPVWDRRN